MHENLNIGIALIAGIASFISPCILPLIPAYLSLMGGATLKELETRGEARWAAVSNTALFVVGFTIVFVALGIVFSTTFGLLGGAVQIVNAAAGIVVIILGLNFIFNFIGFLNFEKRLHMSGRPAGKVGSVLFGMAFGAGWTPCIGPILGSILLLAGNQGSIGTASLLLAAYSLGLGAPFLLTGYFLSPALRHLARLKRHMAAIKVASGIFLIFIGALILLGELKGFNAFAFSVASSLDAWGAQHPLGARIVPGSVAAAAGLLPAMRAVVSVPVRFRPGSIVFAAVCAVLSVLAFSGVLIVPHLLSVWLDFQGI